MHPQFLKGLVNYEFYYILFYTICHGFIQVYISSCDFIKIHGIVSLMRFLSKNILIFGITILLSMGVFCAMNGVVPTSHQTMNGNMSILCASESYNPAFCAINMSSHALFLKTISHTVPQKIGEYLLILALELIIFIFWKKFMPHLQKLKLGLSRLYIKSAAVFSILNSLRYAFSRGIIHPQIYNSTYIS